MRPGSRSLSERVAEPGNRQEVRLSPHSGEQTCSAATCHQFIRSHSLLSTTPRLSPCAPPLKGSIQSCNRLLSYLPLPSQSFLDCLPQAGRLRHFSNSWALVSRDRWISDTVRGYRLDLMSPPPFQGVEGTYRQLETSLQTKLDLECMEMLSKGAVIKIPHSDQQFVSPFFAVPRAGTDKIRAIIDLRAMNNYLRYDHFKMESLRTVRDLLLHDDLLLKIDLKDAYFSVPVHPSHQRYLQFQWRDQLYQFTCLPFGLASAPRVFTKTLHPVVTVLRSLGIRLVIYLDDLLLMVRTHQEAQRHLATTLHMLVSLGFSINWRKSQLTHHKQVDVLGCADQLHYHGVHSSRRQGSEACVSMPAAAQYAYNISEGDRICGGQDGIDSCCDTPSSTTLSRLAVTEDNVPSSRSFIPQADSASISVQDGVAMVGSSFDHMEWSSRQDSRPRPDYPVRCFERRSFGLGCMLWDTHDKWPVDLC